ncbi:hypothetical protein B0I35DRAFT_278935 [Stachybotrys elegans]|uniref:Uncharacterized protein n=1 Tax=Stachybotrys elegans TaxID=80388 RepID=A0A8K0SJE2_9HYPO|nr:hypothetical protein B0I35DRAFT_278935 [Stachybotrys elegans]
MWTNATSVHVPAVTPTQERPSYASACANDDAYASACACLGITPVSNVDSITWTRETTVTSTAMVAPSPAVTGAPSVAKILHRPITFTTVTTVVDAGNRSRYKPVHSTHWSSHPDRNCPRRRGERGCAPDTRKRLVWPDYGNGEWVKDYEADWAAQLAETQRQQEAQQAYEAHQELEDARKLEEMELIDQEEYAKLKAELERVKTVTEENEALDALVEASRQDRLNPEEVQEEVQEQVEEKNGSIDWDESELDESEVNAELAKELQRVEANIDFLQEEADALRELLDDEEPAAAAEQEPEQGSTSKSERQFYTGRMFPSVFDRTMQKNYNSLFAPGGLLEDTLDKK